MNNLNLVIVSPYLNRIQLIGKLELSYHYLSVFTTQIRKWKKQGSVPLHNYYCFKFPLLN